MNTDTKQSEKPRGILEDYKCAKKKESLLNRFSCKILNKFLFVIPPYFKKRKLTKNGSDSYQGQPYIVVVENHTSRAIHNVALFGSYDALSRDVFDKDGNYNARGIKISCNIPNLSYKDVLCSFSGFKFKVGLTYVTTVNQKQIFSPLKIVKKKILGDLSENILVNTKDPYQHQVNILATRKEYEIDGLTSVIIPILQPKTTVTYYFYPVPIGSLVEPVKQNVFFRFFNFLSNKLKKEDKQKLVPVIQDKPITVEVANYTDEVKKDVSLFGSFANLKTDEKRFFNKSNSLVFNDVCISSLTPNISYAEVLNYFYYNKANIGVTSTRISDGDLTQLNSDFKIKTQEDENTAQKTFVGRIDPYQHQVDVTVNKNKFSVCRHTEFIIAELKPKTTVVYQFYPED